jgi:hypothetical protein
MSKVESHIAVRASTSHAESPTPHSSVVSLIMEQAPQPVTSHSEGKGCMRETTQDLKSNCATEGQQQEKLHKGDGTDTVRVVQQQDSKDLYIPSPPAITHWNLMSTAATTITSNVQSRTTAATTMRHDIPYMLPLVDPPTSSSHRRLDRHYRTDTVMEETDHNAHRYSNSSTADAPPPMHEIQVPSRRPADIDDENEDDDDVDTTTSTQNLSRDGDQNHRYSRQDVIDYKGLFFTSQRQNYELHGQLQYIQEDNRKLKRQLIEMQKQLYAHGRNKRPAMTTLQHPHHRHQQYRTEVAPWSIPTSTNNVQPPCLQYRQPHRALMVRGCGDDHDNNATTTKITAATDNACHSPPTTFVSPELVTTSPQATNGVSMSVSSEESGNNHI